MVRKYVTRPRFEQLEDRCTPATGTAVIADGSLSVTVQGDMESLHIEASHFVPHTYRVILDGELVVLAEGITNSINIDLSQETNGGETTLKLTGNNLTGGITVTGSSGADFIFIDQGSVTGMSSTVGGNLTVSSSGGDDVIDLGSDSVVSGPFVVLGNVNINGGAGVDTFRLNNSTSVAGDVATFFAEDVTIRPNSTIGDDLVVLGSLSGSNNLQVDGRVGGDVLYFGGLLLISGQDTVVLNGAVGGNVQILTGVGSDSVTFGANLTVGGRVNVNLGGGSDTFHYNTPQTTPIIGAIEGGAGTDFFFGDPPDTIIVSGFEN